MNEARGDLRSERIPDQDNSRGDVVITVDDPPSKKLDFQAIQVAAYQAAQRYLVCRSCGGRGCLRNKGPGGKAARKEWRHHQVECTKCQSTSMLHLSLAYIKLDKWNVALKETLTRVKSDAGVLTQEVRSVRTPVSVYDTGVSDKTMEADEELPTPTQVVDITTNWGDYMEEDLEYEALNQTNAKGNMKRKK